MASEALIDEKAVHRNRARAEQMAGEGTDFLMHHAVDDLVLRLSTLSRHFDLACDVGAATPAATHALVNSDRVSCVVRMAHYYKSRATGDRSAHFIGRQEALPLKAQSLDLAISLLSLQFANDLPGTLIQIRRSLKPDGLFLGCLIGGRSLHELRTAFLQAEAEMTGGAETRILPFIDVRDAGGLLQRAGFALPVADVDTLTVRYDTAFHLMHDLRAMGASNPISERRKGLSRRGVFTRMAEIYAERFSDPDGRVRATFDLVSLSGWHPHESQQKPLKPGSAKVSLKDVLKP